MQQTEMTAELYSSWRSHPVTQALFEAFSRLNEDAKESWLSGHFTDESNASGTFLVQAREQERARVFRMLIELTGEDFLQLVGAQ